MDINKFFKSQLFTVIILSISAVLILLLVFAAGVVVGAKKAEFTYRWGDNYHKNFGGPKNGFFRELPDRGMMPGNGTFGEILKIDGQNIILKGGDDVEKSVLVSDDTSIRRFMENIKMSDLKTGDRIIVIGEPNSSGQIGAKLIRVVPR